MFYVRTSSHRSSVRRSGDSERAAAEAGVLRNFITFRGRTAGLALSAASLALVPSALLVEDVAIAPLVAIVSVGVASGLLFAVLPWHRVSPVWMSAIPAFATLQIAALAVTVSQSYEFLYLPVAIATAYAFGTRRTVIAQLGLILACLSVPLALESDAWRTSLQHVFLLAPIVAAAAALALRVREEQEAKDRAYRLFSTEVQELSSRMLGHAGHPFDPEHLPRPRAEVPAAAGVAALPDAGETPMNGSNGGRRFPRRHRSAEALLGSPSSPRRRWSPPRPEASPLPERRSSARRTRARRSAR